MWARRFIAVNKWIDNTSWVRGNVWTQICAETWSLADWHMNTEADCSSSSPDTTLLMSAHVCVCVCVCVCSLHFDAVRPRQASVNVVSHMLLFLSTLMPRCSRADLRSARGKKTFISSLPASRLTGDVQRSHTHTHTHTHLREDAWWWTICRALILELFVCLIVDCNNILKEVTKTKTEPGKSRHEKMGFHYFW